MLKQPSSSTLLSAAQARRVDEIAVQTYGMSSLVLMENAGRGAAEWIRELGAQKVIICCGKGNNAGDGFVVARHLANSGATVQLLLTAEPASYTHDARINFQIAQAMGIPSRLGCGSRVILEDSIDVSADLIVDALLGTGSTGAPRSPMAELIRLVNGSRKPVFALDLPSGLCADTGQAADPTIRATYTGTFAALKRGLVVPEAQSFVGTVRVIDIGVPRAAIIEASTWCES